MQLDFGPKRDRKRKKYAKPADFPLAAAPNKVMQDIEAKDQQFTGNGDKYNSNG